MRKQNTSHLNEVKSILLQVWSIPEGCFQLAAAAVSRGNDDDYEVPMIPKKSKQIATSIPAIVCTTLQE